MKIDKIIEIVGNHTPQIRDKWFQKCLNLFHQFESSFNLSEPYRLVLDSNIIMRFENLNIKENNIDLLAVLTFFEFFKSQDIIKASILIRPPVFFEFIGKRQLNDELDYWNNHKKIRELIKETIGLDTLFEGLYSYEMAVNNIEAIIYDEKIIKKHLEKIKKWDLTEILNEFKISNQSNLIEEIRNSYKIKKLKYFDNKITEMCLAEGVINKIEFTENDIISNYQKSEYHVFHKILKIRKKGYIEGLADLDFLYTCNTKLQFEFQANFNYIPTSIPLSIDGNLSSGLNLLSKHIVINTIINTSEPEELIHMKFEKSMLQNLKIKEGEVKFNKYKKSAVKYWKKIDIKLNNIC